MQNDRPARSTDVLWPHALENRLQAHSPGAVHAPIGRLLACIVAVALGGPGFAGGPVKAEPVQTIASPSAPSAADTLLPTATFDAAWERIRDTYWDPELDGLDWEGVRAELRPRAEAAESPAELRSVLREMLARVGASHFVLIPSEAGDERPTGSNGSASTGLELRWTGDGALVTRVEEDTPAAEVGIRAGHEIRAIAGRNVDDIVSELRSMEDEPGIALPPYWITTALTRHLQGPPGTTIEIALRGDEESELHLSLTLREPSGELVRFGNLPPFRLLTEDRAIALPGGGEVGLIRFTGWFPASAPAVAAAVDRFRESDGIVIDLRGNPGGIGGLVMGIGGHFLDDRVNLGSMRTRETTVRFVVNPQRVAPDGRRVTPFKGPLAILVDGLSGSTSEIFAAGMQAIGRARIFGEPTAGEALPALVVELPNGDRLMHAVADFTAPDGARLEGRGVQPDELVTPDRASLLEGGDPVLRSALDWIAGVQHQSQETER